MNIMLSPRAIPFRKRLRKYTDSEHDWVWVLRSLAPVNGLAKWSRNEPVVGAGSNGLYARFLRSEPGFNFVSEQERCFAPEEL
jgi:hypothetical protein